MRSASTNISVKILGMIGGTGPESTVEYYRRLIVAYHARISESGAPPIILNSVDNKNLVKWFAAGELAHGGRAPQSLGAGDDLRHDLLVGVALADPGLELRELLRIDRGERPVAGLLGHVNKCRAG